MENYYQVLGVPRTASASIVKIAYEGKLKALAKAELPDAERRVEERALEQAYVTLSNPAKKEWYDRQLDSHAEGEEAAVASSHYRGWFVAAALALILISGIGYYFVDRANTREKLRLEEQRIALEREKAQAQAEAERVRLQLSEDAQRFRQESETRAAALRERAYSDHSEQAARDRAVQNQVLGGSMNAAEQRQQQANEDRDRRLAEQQRRQAQADVDRQKAWTRQRELEDERIRADRAYRAQREAEIARAKEAAERRRSP
ncbi:MAG TPA: DnaJ domain-containing protein [Usitatibacter sp.]